MTQGYEQRRRRRLFFYKGFQPGFVWGFLVAGSAVLLPLVLSSLILLKLQGRPSIPDVFPLLLALNIIALLALLIMAYWVALFISHRMGGPLFRLEAALASLGQGYLNERASVRKNDQLQSFAETLDQAQAGLRERVEQLRHRAGELQRLAQDSPATPELRQEIERLRAHLEEMFVL